MTTPADTMSHRADTNAAPARSAQRISVALCTYNGARYLEPQLQSIPAQTRLPDELVVCDDGSTDGTLDILARFARNAPFPVQIVHNATRLGSTKNFEKAIGLCTSELIATCDQDDVWLPDKLALSEAAIDAVPGRGLVFTDSDVVDDELRSLGHTMWDAIRFGRLARRRVRGGRAFDVLLRQWVVTGATMMFRSNLRRYVLPIPENWVHDGWIAFIIGALTPIGFVERPTLKYRQHAAQQIGGRKLGLGELYRKAREVGPTHFQMDYDRFQRALERLRAFSAELQDASIVARVEGKVTHQRRRLSIAEARSRWKRVFWSLYELLRGGYHRYSPASTHFLKDMLL